MSKELSMNGNGVDASKEQLISDLKVVLTETNELLKQVGASSVSELSDARKAIDGKLAEGRAKLRAVRESVVDRVRGTVDASDDYIRDHPWKALGVVAAGGILVGLLLTRR